MHAVLRLRTRLLAVVLLAYLGLQALALVHEYDGEQHPAGEICGLCLSIAQLDKALPAAALPPACVHAAPRPDAPQARAERLATLRTPPARGPPSLA